MGVKDLMAELTKGTVKPLKDWDMKDKWIAVDASTILVPLYTETLRERQLRRGRTVSISKNNSIEYSIISGDMV